MPEVQDSKSVTVPERLNAAGSSAQEARQLTFEAFKALDSDLVPFHLRDHAARLTTDLDGFMAELALFNSGLARSGGHR